ncbi:MAG TPA: flagellar export chaperone FliS [Candidatus Saccharimonadales bacterium]|nr:flagellar export chaperone FliS [Candidatus Saccharimonadales bacterium]
MTPAEVNRNYREAAIRGASSVECTIMLYDIVISDLRKAMSHLGAGEVEARSNALVHCLQALEQLQGTLQMETGGEAAKHLYRFYSLARAKILEGQLTCKVQLFEEIVRSMQEVRALWLQVKDQCQSLDVPEPWAVPCEGSTSNGAWKA